MTTISYFLSNRKEICDAVDAYHAHQCVIIRAPVKSGKSDFVKYEALKKPNALHIFVTAFSAADCREQIASYRSAGIFTVQTAQLRADLDVEVIKVFGKKKNKEVYIYVDECDYGNSDGLTLKTTINKVLRFVGKKNTHYRFFSATAEKNIVEQYIKKDAMVYFYKPPASYFGPAQYLRAGLARQSECFYDEQIMDLSEQAYECLNLLDDERRIGVLRLAGKQQKHKASIASILESMDITPIFISKDEEFYWGRQPTENVRSYSTLPSGKVCLIINQTCTRSTLVGFHPYIAFWHDHRENAMFSTVSQAQERVNYYSGAYEIEPKIHLYGDIDALRFSAALSECENISQFGVIVAEFIKTVNIDGFKWVRNFRKTEKALATKEDIKSIIEHYKENRKPSIVCSTRDYKASYTINGGYLHVNEPLPFILKLEEIDDDDPISCGVIKALVNQGYVYAYTLF